MHTKFAGKNHMARLVVDGRTVFKWILQKYVVKVKGQVVSANAMKTRRGSRSIAPLILNLVTTWR
jgi:hypothetical protein